jgi:hypothetical protein
VTEADRLQVTSELPPAREPGRPWSYAAAAEFLGVCPATVARACRGGRIASVALGRRKLIPDHELRRVAREGF